MIGSYIKLGIAALIPVFASGFFYLLEKKTKFGELSYYLRQLILGLVFGGLAILGTEWGIPMNSAQVNCRDAAPLCAGLLFGGPAGIIAGVIGGLERWFAVYWGVGSFTRVACSVSTVIAGLYAALLRKYLFEDKKPGWLLCLIIGIVMEVFHVNMVFVTNADQAAKASMVVRACTIPMVTANGLSVMLASLTLSLLAREKPQSYEGPENISKQIQKGLLVCVLAAFVVTTAFMVFLQSNLTNQRTETELTQALEDTVSAVDDASDKNLLQIAHTIETDLDEDCTLNKVQEVAHQFGLAEINLVDKSGSIHRSNVISYLGFRMDSGEQAAEFLCLLDGKTKEYVQPYAPQISHNFVWRKYAGVATAYGFLQVGYDAEQFQSAVTSEIALAVRNRRVGSTGLMVVADEKGDVVSSTAGVEIPEGTNLKETLAGHEPGEVFRISFEGRKFFLLYDMAEGYYVLALLPSTEAYDEMVTEIYVNTFMEILVFAAVFVLIYLLIKRLVVKNIDRVNQRLGEITSGNLNVVVDVRSSSEFSSLSDDINSTVNTLKRYIEEAAARIDKELEFAKNIQSSALPKVFPNRQDYDIHCTMDTAKEVGGDFYDFYHTDPDHLNVLIADVSGKGIPAAMFMMRGKTQLKSLTETGLSVDQVFTDGNHGLCEGNDAGMFITGWQGCVDLNTGLVEFANAGHNPPVIRHADGSAEYLKSRAGLVLAGMDGLRYKKQTMELKPGDVLFLYTDGVTEATSLQTELYGEDRLLNCITNAKFSSMEELCKIVKADVDAFVGEAEQFDDITMVALQFNGR